MTRTEAIDDLAEYLICTGLLKPGINAESLAAELIDSREPSRSGEINVEVPSRYTVNGIAMPMTFKVEDWQ